MVCSRKNKEACEAGMEGGNRASRALWVMPLWRDRGVMEGFIAGEGCDLT